MRNDDIKTSLEIRDLSIYFPIVGKQDRSAQRVTGVTWGLHSYAPRPLRLFSLPLSLSSFSDTFRSCPLPRILATTSPYLNYPNVIDNDCSSGVIGAAWRYARRACSLWSTFGQLSADSPFRHGGFVEPRRYPTSASVSGTEADLLVGRIRSFMNFHILVHVSCRVKGVCTSLFKPCRLLAFVRPSRFPAVRPKAISLPLPRSLQFFPIAISRTLNFRTPRLLVHDLLIPCRVTYSGQVGLLVDPQGRTRSPTPRWLAPPDYLIPQCSGQWSRCWCRCYMTVIGWTVNQCC